METNASSYEISLVLLQNEQPLVFFSQAFPSTTIIKSVYEEEHMGTVQAI